MKKKLLWAVLILLVLATAWRLSWPRLLPVERMYGDPELPGSFEEMVNRAELIVLADIKSVKQGPDYLAPIGTDSVYREPTQRVTPEVVKVYKGNVAQGQTVTLFQGSVGVTQSIQGYPWPVFRINENDPVYARGERYILMLWPVPISEEIKPYQPEPWQEGMFSVVSPDGRMRLNADGTVTSALNSFSTNGKTLEEIAERITATIDSLPKYNLGQAREALLTYFSLLHSQRYDEAIYFYGGSYDLLRDWNPAVDPDDYIALFKNGCTINGLMCLQVRRIMQEEQVSPDEFKFIVEFMNEHGSRFVLGPDTSLQSLFSYPVQNVDGRFLIQDLPVYVP